uniref:Uncharacterized protein n=1 Tax=Candidatus Kentrum sp. MB TaxID=2138164 RepID=A0A451BEW6_9GAMM|nr:MAG: hypothetical protein BECKMB1821I_GA0114274_10797 [Candidatus Kentron sp. MB]VFK76823.1 MAG: hypothetical protein BECKMB1821H_GA0114242_10777 [Candidatus Kentron sp. MB]
MKKLFIGLLTSMFITSFAYAGCSDISCKEKMSRVYPQGDRVYISLNGRVHPSNCSLVGGWYFTLLDSNPKHEEIYALALAAKLSDKPVLLRTKDGSNICEIVYAILE